MKVFGLELEQQYADTFIAAISVNDPEKFGAALSECSPEDIVVLEKILNEYYRATKTIRDAGTSNQRKESIAAFFSVAAAPVLSLFIPSLLMKTLDAPKSILLAQLGYGDKFGRNISLARGYMVERLITQGNTWEKPISEYVWLGENYRRIGSIASQLESRESVDRGLITEMLKSVPSMSGGSL